jgi:hypothetical protein
MRRLLMAILLLALGGVLALIGVAIFSDLPAPQREVELPIEAE